MGKTPVLFGRGMVLITQPIQNVSNFPEIIGDPKQRVSKLRSNTSRNFNCSQTKKKMSGSVFRM